MQPEHSARTNLPKHCPRELGIDSWRFRLKQARFGEWNGQRLGDIPNSAVLQLWKSEAERNPSDFIVDKLLGEVIRRGLIGDRKPKSQKKCRRNRGRRNGKPGSQ